MKIAFFGTPAFAVPTLDRLLSSAHVVAVVVTQPDRPKGRGHKLAMSDVKTAAVAYHLPVLQPDRMAAPGFRAAIEDFSPDLGVVAAYGQLLPQWLLDVPRLGFVNVHASLLPRWRGAAPVHRAILAGDRETGITIMRVVRALDAGPMLSRVILTIDENETSGELEARLATAGAALLTETVDRLASGTVPELPQDESLVTYAHRLTREDSPVEWDRPAVTVHNQIRGLNPWPLAAARLDGRRLLLRRSVELADNFPGVPPGTVSRVDGHVLVVACQDGSVGLTMVQPEGRASMSVREFLNGHDVHVGARFEP